MYAKEQIVLEIYTTLVLWYLAKKVLRHRSGKRKFLIRSQGFASQRVLQYEWQSCPQLLLPADLQ